MEEYNSVYYSYLIQYVADHHLMNAEKSLQLITDRMAHSEGRQEIRLKKEFQHALSIVHILLDLHIPFSPLEKDLLLSVSLCHFLSEDLNISYQTEELLKQYGIDSQVQEILELIRMEEDTSEQELKPLFEHIKKNKIALMVALADQSNIAQQIHKMSSWNARKYIYETRTYYFPMCIYGKEHYPEILGSISILMEKMRNLIELTEMMLSRYEAKEMELTQDILALREENATIRGIILQLRGES